VDVMPANSAVQIMNTPADLQQQQQTRNARATQVVAQAKTQRNAPTPTGGDVRVTISADARKIAETAKTAAANENADQVVNNNSVNQNPPQPQQQQTQKTINRIGGTA